MNKLCLTILIFSCSVVKAENSNRVMDNALAALCRGQEAEALLLVASPSSGMSEIESREFHLLFKNGRDLEREKLEKFRKSRDKLSSVDRIISVELALSNPFSKDKETQSLLEFTDSDHEINVHKDYLIATEYLIHDRPDLGLPVLRKIIDEEGGGGTRYLAALIAWSASALDLHPDDKNGNFEAASSLMSDENPYKWNLKSWIALLNNNFKQNDASLEFAARSYRLCPSLSEISSHYAAQLYASGKRLEAKDIFLQIRKRDPDVYNPFADLTVASISLAEGDFKQLDYSLDRAKFSWQYLSKRSLASIIEMYSKRRDHLASLLIWYQYGSVLLLILLFAISIAFFRSRRRDSRRRPVTDSIKNSAN